MSEDLAIIWVRSYNTTIGKGKEAYNREVMTYNREG